MIDINKCVTCKAKQDQLKKQLGLLKISVKQKAINEVTTYAIWFDFEDKKFYHATYESFTSKGIAKHYEVISKYQ